MRRFQLAVIGTGTAASTAAMQVRDAGWSVAVIDARPFGGTCALRGCDPKKVLIGDAALVDAARRQRDKGVAGDVRLDWARAHHPRWVEAERPDPAPGEPPARA